MATEKITQAPVENNGPQQRAPQIRIATDERIFFCGRTGSGKTTLAKFICKGVQRLVVLDSKGTLHDWNLEPDSAETREAMRQGENIRIRFHQPVDEPEVYWEKVFRFVFEVQDLVVYIDELYMIVEPGRQAPDAMRACYQQGREFGIGMWASTQRPSWVPGFTMSEDDHWFMFRLMKLKDRQTMAEYMTDQVAEETIKDKHGFWYMNVDQDEPIYVPSLYTNGNAVRPPAEPVTAEE